MPFRIKSLLVGVCAVCAAWLLWGPSPSREAVAVRARAAVEPPISLPAKALVDSDPSPAKSISETASGETIEGFRTWANQFTNTIASERAVLLANGIELAQARQASLRELMESDPKAAWDAAPRRPLPFRTGYKHRFGSTMLLAVKRTDL